MRWPASTPSPRAIGAISLAVLGACGAALVLTAPPANQARAAASLLSRSNWVLATALPASQDVPADWGYSLTGRLRRAVSPSTVPPAALPNTSRAAVYSPAGCGNIPKILDHSSADLAAYVQIDRDVQVFGQDAPLDAAATGESDERGPNARFALWAVADGPARIANYLDWLNRCGSYQVTNHFWTERSRTNEPSPPRWKRFRPAVPTPPSRSQGRLPPPTAVTRRRLTMSRTTPCGASCWSAPAIFRAPTWIW